MDVKEMHVLFRVLGQQMGLEMVRGILPESIDSFLNAACIELATNIVKSNVQTVFQDKVTIQNNPTSVINGVSTLYVESNKEIDTNSGDTVDIEIQNVMFLTGFSISANGTRFHQCRIIEPDKVDITLDDYCSRASLKYPIITLVECSENNNKYTFRIFGGTESIKNIRIKYIKMPNKIEYVDGTTANDKQCDLPEHLHKDIVELAVSKYLAAVGSTTHEVR